METYLKAVGFVAIYKLHLFEHSDEVRIKNGMEIREAVRLHTLCPGLIPTGSLFFSRVEAALNLSNPSRPMVC
jgi:hypothetical protein